MSKSSASAMVRGAGMAADIWGKIDEAVRAKGGTEEALHQLARPEGSVFIEALADLLVKSEMKTRNRFSVTVDYSRPLDQAIAAGKYGYVNPDITSANFPLRRGSPEGGPITGTGKVDIEIILVDFGCDISSDDAEKELAVMGLEPVGIEHATAFGEKYPDVQRERPIVFLGSVWSDASGGIRVPYLGGWDGGRGLYLSFQYDEWGRHYRFAAVRLPAKATP